MICLRAPRTTRTLSSDHVRRAGRHRSGNSIHSQIYACSRAPGKRSNGKLCQKSLSSIFTSHTQCRLFSGNALGTTNVETKGNYLNPKRRLLTLAIETSCDDTSVAILSISCQYGGSSLKTDVVFHEKVTARSEAYNGIHPLVALESHQMQLGQLVQKAVEKLRSGAAPTRPDRPDFVTVTRGPGMRSNLAVGLDVAKGLAIAWGIPLAGAHHMQAHALTPRLCSTLESKEGKGRVLHRADDDANERVEWSPETLEPRFPFLGVLASGGHTMLIDSKSLNDHKILAETANIAIGDCLDKAARAILPLSDLKFPYGKALEEFAFPTDSAYHYTPPAKRQDELERRSTQWGWSLAPPLSESKSGQKSSRRMMYSFGGLLTYVERLSARDMGLSERRELAREVQRIAFEHLVSRILLHLTTLRPSQRQEINTIVLSGGVASNAYLRHILRSTLDIRGFEQIKLICPPAELCTDNALMIAWAGMEMYDAGYVSELGIRPIRKWRMDFNGEDGGVLGVGGWKERLHEDRSCGL